jgi:hypothetical protein
MRLKVTARLFLDGGAEEIVQAVLCNEAPEGTPADPVLLVDGEATQLRYEVLRIGSPQERR